VIMNVQELIDLLEDCDPEAFGSRTCRAGRWPSSCAAWPCPMTGRMRATRRPPEAGAAPRPGLLRRVHRAPSTPQPPTLRAGVPGRRLFAQYRVGI
jgi:hypothetical protein